MLFFILGLSALSASIFALDIEILLYPDENLVRKWILKGTKLKTPFHIALFRKDFRSHCTFFSGSKFCNASDKSRFILGNI